MKNHLATNILRTFSTQVSCQVIAVLSGIVIARMIGPSGKGFVSYAATAVSFVSVFFYGFSDAVIYQFGKQKQPVKAVYAAAVRIFVVVLAVVIPVFIAVSIVMPSQRPLAAAAAALPFAMYLQVMTPFLMVRDNILLVNVRSIVQSLGTALLTIPLLIFMHLGLTAVLGVWLLFYVIAAIQSYLAMRPILASSAVCEVSSVLIMREQLRFGLRAAGSSAAGFLNMRIDIIVVSIMLSSASLGWYTLAIGSGELMWQVSRAFVWSALGRIGSDPLPQSAALVARLTRNTLVIVGSLGVIAFITGPWLIIHVYGVSFAPAGDALRWALPGLVAYAAETAITKFVVLQLERPLTILWLQSAAATLCAILTVSMVRHYGIVAAAASTSVTYLLVTGVLVTMFVRGTGITPQRLLIIQSDDLAHYSALLQSMLRTLKLRSA